MSLLDISTESYSYVRLVAKHGPIGRPAFVISHFKA